MTTNSNSHTNYNDLQSLDRKILSTGVFDQLFTQARSHHHWRDKEVSDEDLKALYEIINMVRQVATCSLPELYSFEVKQEKKSFIPH